MIPLLGHAAIYALLIVLSTGHFCLADTTPHPFLGSWEVAQVAVDLADQPHWRYEPNDPRIVGRIMTISANGSISFNYGRELCDRVNWIAEGKTKLSTLLGKTFPRPPHPGSATAPTLKDFDLRIENTTVTPYRLICQSTSRSNGKRQYWGDARFIPLSLEKILVLYDGDTILLLQSPPAAAPSYRCSGKLSATETAICNSAALAGYDRSVAAAFRRGLQRRESERELLQKEQQDWLQERNRCMSDHPCIEKRMRERVDDLMQD